ncbi:hypothetical protein COCSADRAFT_159968 [Bipolaris sorokiniana ND90Pr]|uniref:Uncharacterized protein n=1 Tax=Cochliobolus sativus (strain ND90Pr / ATCC 201652) TaxID=665912 RepID=M2T6V1_COCSN|nr:uncharacterized protein COCSADRAFT_159968 [Bipolaris sorokiniana ND90Pr]EMD64976.1 hypothetical protein COCSADRAFT_159968 [Bipolaris sorokiniana ND90Pr]
MHLSLLLIFFLHLLITALTVPNSPTESALALLLEGTDPSTVLYTPIPTVIHALDAAITANTNAHANNANDANEKNLPTQTITQTARVTQTTRPHDPEPIILYPFHLTLTSLCSSPSPANATLTNGNWTSRIINLTSLTRAIVDHHIPAYPQTFSVGPFDARRGELRFGRRKWSVRLLWGGSISWRRRDEMVYF